MDASKGKEVFVGARVVFVQPTVFHPSFIMEHIGPEEAFLQQSFAS